MTEILSLIKNNAIFNMLSDTALIKLSAALKKRSLEAGQVLFNYGDPGDEMVIVDQGKVAIYMPDKDNPQLGQALRIFQAGEAFGEMALLDKLPRSASARAETPTTILTLDSLTFEHLLEENADMAVAVMGGLSGRIRYTTNFIGELRQWVKRMAEGDYQSIQAPAGVSDSSLSALAADFVRMAARVREREEKLQQEVAQLRIQIDEKKRRESVSQITQSDYYLSLREKLKALREDDDE